MEKYSCHCVGVQSMRKYYLLVFSSFGPQLLPAYGVYLGHVVIYSMFISDVIVPSLYKGRFSLSGIFFYPILLWFGIIVLSVASTGYNLNAANLKFIASVENYIQPLTVLLLANTWFKNKHAIELRVILNKLSYFYLICLSINSAIILLTFFSVETYSVTKFFFRHESGVSVDVFESAFNDSMGRYTGIFHSPFEAGLSYSIAILCLMYVYSFEKAGLIWYSLLSINACAGFFTGSKVYIFVGFIVFVVYLIKARLFVKMLHDYKIVTLILFLPTLVLMVSTNWIGFSYIQGFFNFHSTEEFVYAITSGRLSLDDPASTFSVISQIPYTGNGFLSVGFAFDNAFVEILYQGGVAAVIIYAMLWFCLFYFPKNSIGRMYESALYEMLIVLCFFAGFGGPIFTVNRVSVVLIMFISLAALIVRETYKRSRGQTHGSA